MEFVSYTVNRFDIIAATVINNFFAESWHDWSSDGKWLAFNSSDAEEKQFHITLMNWNTKEQKRLTDATYKTQQAPVFIER